MALGLRKRQYLGLYMSYKQRPHLGSVSIGERTLETILLPPLRATRPKQRHTLGMNTTRRFASDLAVYICDGAATKGQKRAVL